MRAGKLDRRVTIQVRSVAQNSVGEEVESWGTLAEVWAGIEPQQAIQRFAVNQLLSEVSQVFRVRWYEWGSTIDPNQHRLVYRDRVYDIQGVFEIGRREGLQIACKARQDNDAGSN